MENVWVTREGEFYLHPQHGKVHKRVPAGGHGGGVTSYVDNEASEAESLAYFRAMSEQKEAEIDTLQERHAEAKGAIERRRAEEEPKLAEEQLPVESQSEIDPPGGSIEAPAEV